MSAIGTWRERSARAAAARDGSKPLHPLRRFLPMYTAIAPFYVLFAVFGAFPVFFSLYLSFQSWDGIGKMKGVGFQNYAYLLTSPDFWTSIGNTVVIWILATVPMLFLALVVAYALHTTVRFRTLYRVAYFLPNVTSIVAMTLVFGSVFSNNFGLLNVALKSVGLDQVQWLTDNWTIKLVIAVISTWRWVGYNAIIFLAGLQAIPADLYEAAKVDGASNAQTFFRITIPSLRPVILFAAVTSTIGGLQLFSEPFVLFGDNNGTVGGPGNAGTTIVLYLYQQAFDNNQFGYGAAVAWALFVLIALFSIINWRLISDRDEAAAKAKAKRKGKSRES